MIFQVEITPSASSEIEQADRWFRGLMNEIATLQEKPRRCSLAVESDIFPEEVRQLLYGKSQNPILQNYHLVDRPSMIDYCTASDCLRAALNPKWLRFSSDRES